MEDKEIYTTLGEIRKAQEMQTKMMEEMNKRVAWMETKINYAIGVVASTIFFFQAGWTYLTKMGKS